MAGLETASPLAGSGASSQAFWCCVFAGGIIVTLVVYGVLQERVMQVPYDGAVFKYSVFLVFLNRVANVIFALGMAMAKGEDLTNKAPLWKYLVVSLSNVFASSCQYEALKYVSFAVQMLGKSFKMLPVMLWGLAISGKEYKWKDWAVAMAVTGGVTEFLMTGPTASSTASANSAHGLLLLLAFLALDGLTSTMQEKMFKEHKTSKYNQILYVNTLSSGVSLLTLLLSGSLWPAVSFYFEHPAFVVDSTLISASSVASQFFIYSLVQDFGALAFAATMNVRQVVSIVVSYVHYGHIITLPQVVGLGCVFAALFYKSYDASRSVALPKDTDDRRIQAPLAKPGAEGGAAYGAAADAGGDPKGLAV